MKDKKSGEIIYYPVGPICDRLAGVKSATYFANAIDPVSKSFLKHLKKKKVATDSGGFQIFKALDKGQMVLVGSLFKTTTYDSDVLVLGTIDQCREYARMHSNIAMCIDFPTRTDDTDLAYWWKLSQSRQARDEMLTLSEYFCPNTRLGIALQPRTPLEIKDYFCHMYTPAIDIYAYPIRNFRNKPKDALGNAYVLSFLHDVGIKHCHFLGSNAPAIIFLLAKAAALNMFDRVSFDSTTWIQRAFAGVRYLHPDTLSPRPKIITTKTKGKGKRTGLHRKANLREALARYPGLFEDTLGRFNPPKWAKAGDWTGIFNIEMINRFKDQALQLAIANDLQYYIKNEFRKYSAPQKEMIIEALDLLQQAKARGHEYIERHYSSEIERRCNEDDDEDEE